MNLYQYVTSKNLEGYKFSSYIFREQDFEGQLWELPKLTENQIRRMWAYKDIDDKEYNFLMKVYGYKNG